MWGNGARKRPGLECPLNRGLLGRATGFRAMMWRDQHQILMIFFRALRENFAMIKIAIVMVIRIHQTCLKFSSRLPG